MITAHLFEAKIKKFKKFKKFRINLNSSKKKDEIFLNRRRCSRDEEKIVIINAI